MLPDDDETRGIWAELRVQRDILIELRTLIREYTEKADDHETRIRRLEERKFPLPAVGVLIAVASLAVALLPYLVHH